MDAGVEVKVEEYDGSYDCLFCGDSVRGTAALVCGECNSNPWHRACDKDFKYGEVCPTCNRKSVKMWIGARAGDGSPSEIIDLTGDVGGGAEVAEVPGNGAQEDAVPAVGGGVVAADVSRQGKCGGSSICQHNRIKSVARSAEGRASASTTGEEASARRARQTRTTRCRQTSRSSECHRTLVLSRAD